MLLLLVTNNLKSNRQKSCNKYGLVLQVWKASEKSELPSDMSPPEGGTLAGAFLSPSDLRAFESASIQAKWNLRVG